MRYNYVLALLILAAAYNPASFCAEEAGEGWAAAPDVIKKYIERDTDKNFFSGQSGNIKITYRCHGLPHLPSRTCPKNGTKAPVV